MFILLTHILPKVFYRALFYFPDDNPDSNTPFMEEIKKV